MTNHRSVKFRLSKVVQKSCLVHMEIFFHRSCLGNGVGSGEKIIKKRLYIYIGDIMISDLLASLCRAETMTLPMEVY